MYIIQVKLTKLSYIDTLFKVWFIQDFILFRVRFRQVSLYQVPLTLKQQASTYSRKD